MFLKDNFILLLFLILPSSIFATTVTVKITDVPAFKGGIISLAICSKANFSTNNINACKGFKTLKVNTKKTNYSFVFKDIKPGEYAIWGYQDIDNTAKLTTNWIGIPREPVFFSVKLNGPPFFSKIKSDISGKIFFYTLNCKAEITPKLL